MKLDLRTDLFRMRSLLISLIIELLNGN